MPVTDKNLLDLPETIAKLDPAGMHQRIAHFPEMLAEQWGSLSEKKWTPCENRPSFLLLAGMGGSGIVGDILAEHLSADASVYPIVVKDYHIPKNIPQPPFVLCVSYSGNTEETISIYQAARERKFPRAVIATGGKLAELAQTDKIPWFPIPTGHPPRAALPYLLSAALFFLEWAKIGSARDAVTEAKAILEKKRREVQPETPQKDNLAKQIALKIHRAIPVMGSSEGMTRVAALRWKGQLNENGKLPAMTLTLPEGDHNEIVPLGSMGKGEFPLHLVQLRDAHDSPRMVKRIDITKSLIATHLTGTTEVWSEGNSILARILSLIYLGDYVSLYVALLRGIDPTPVPPIDRLKRELTR